MGDRSRLKGLDYRLVDLMASPKSISALDSADVVVAMINFINHPAYYAAKNYCKQYGIKFIHCSTRTNNIETINNVIKQSAIECLI